MLRSLRQPENLMLLLGVTVVSLSIIACWFSGALTLNIQPALQPRLDRLPDTEFFFQPPLIFPDLVELILAMAFIGLVFTVYQATHYKRMGWPARLMFLGCVILMLSAVWLHIAPLTQIIDRVDYRNQSYLLMTETYETGDSGFQILYAVVACDSFGWQCRALWRGNYDTLVREIAGGLMIYSISLESDANRLYLQVERAGSTIEFPLEPPA